MILDNPLPLVRVSFSRIMASVLIVLLIWSGTGDLFNVARWQACGLSFSQGITATLEFGKPTLADCVLTKVSHSDVVNN